MVKKNNASEYLCTRCLIFDKESLAFKFVDVEGINEKTPLCEQCVKEVKEEIIYLLTKLEQEADGN